MQYNLVKQFTSVEPNEENIWDFKFDADSITFKEGDIIDLAFVKRSPVQGPRIASIMPNEEKEMRCEYCDMVVKIITQNRVLFHNEEFGVELQISVKTLLQFDQIEYLDKKKYEWMELKLEKRDGGVFDEHIELGMACKFLINGDWIIGVINEITEDKTVSIITNEDDFDFYIKDEAVYVSHDGKLTGFGNIPFIPLVEEK